MNVMNVIEFGKKLRELRIMKGVQQKEISNALGISRPGYAKLENGGNVNLPSRENIEIIARVLGVKPEILIGDNSAFFERFTEEEAAAMQSEESTAYIKVAIAKMLKDKADAEAALNAKFKIDMYYKRV